MKSESKIQQEIVMWFNNTYCLQHHKDRCIIFSVPNEAALSMGNSIKYKLKELCVSQTVINVIVGIIKLITLGLVATGLLSGVSDLIVITPTKLMFFECKDDSGTQSPNQKDFESRIKALGYEYHLVRSLDQFKQIINDANRTHPNN